MLGELWSLSLVSFYERKPDTVKGREESLIVPQPIGDSGYQLTTRVRERERDRETETKIETHRERQGKSERDRETRALLHPQN